MLLLMLRGFLVVAMVAVSVVLLTGGLLVAALNAVSLLSDSNLVSASHIAPATVLVILFSMALLAPAFEWWFKVWRNADRWLLQLLPKK